MSDGPVQVRALSDDELVRHRRLYVELITPAGDEPFALGERSPLADSGFAALPVATRAGLLLRLCEAAMDLRPEVRGLIRMVLCALCPRNRLCSRFAAKCYCLLPVPFVCVALVFLVAGMGS